MEEKTLIRNARLEDAITITRFQLLMAEETEGLELDEEVLTNGVNAVFTNSSRGFYIVAEKLGKVIASTLITPEWSDWRNAWVWWIQSVYVVQEYRRQGVFSEIYDHVLTQAKANHIPGLRLYVDQRNTGARHTYDKLGMVGDHYCLYEFML